MLLKELMTKAKWNNDIERRQRAEMALDFYNNNHDPLTVDGKGYVTAMIYDRIDEVEARVLEKYVEMDNVVKRIVDESSIMFRVAPEIELVNGTDKQKENFKNLLEMVNMNAYLREIQKYANLFGDVGVLPQTRTDLSGRNRKMYIDLITPDISFVQQRDIDPTQAEKFFYQIGVLENTAIPDRILYIYWDIDGKHQCEVKQNGEIDIDTIEDLEAPNYNGNIPVVMFRNYIPVNTFWKPGDNYLVHKNLQIDYRLTGLNMLEDYNLPQKVRIGVDEDYESKTGLTFAEDIKRNTDGTAVGSISYINPNAPINDEKEAIDWRKYDMASSYGLAVDTMKGTTFTSGFHAFIAKQEIIERNKIEQDLYRPSIKELCRNMCIAAIDIGMRFPENPEFDIDFGEITFAESPQEKEQNRTARLSNNTANLIDFELEDNPDLNGDREEAMKIIKIRQEENQKLKPANPFDQELPPVESGE